MLKKTLIIMLLISLFSTFSFAASKDEVNLDNLSPQEKTLYFELLKKSTTNKNSPLAGELAKNIQDLKGIDVRTLTEWRVFITDTIKDICRDLNVSVNDFIQTPAGAGIAGLIVYKVAGKDILFTVVHKVFEVLFIIPFWIFMISLILWLRHKYFSTIIVYKQIEEIKDETGKVKSIIKTDAERKNSYPFYSKDSKAFIAALLIGGFIVTNIITLIFIFH